MSTSPRVIKTITFTPEEWKRIEEAMKKVDDWKCTTSFTSFAQAGVMQLVECIEEM